VCSISLGFVVDEVVWQRVRAFEKNSKIVDWSKVLKEQIQSFHIAVYDSHVHQNEDTRTES
jgi:hypothetical protein